MEALSILYRCPFYKIKPCEGEFKPIRGIYNRYNTKLMTIEQWLRDVHYDKWGTCIWSRDKDGGNQMVADIRGWGAIQNLFKTPEEAEKFQDEVGEFITQAIREKLAQHPKQENLYTEEQVREALKYGVDNSEIIKRGCKDIEGFIQSLKQPKKD